MLALIATIAVIHLVALMSPGPDFLFVTRTAVSQSRGKAMLGVLGIAAGVAFWAGLSQGTITVAGGLYLIWMGWQLLKSAMKKPAETSNEVAAKEGDSIEEGASTMKHPFLFGLLTNLANPKAIIYFGSIFAGLITPDVSDLMRAVIYAMVIGETILWFGFVALIFGLAPMRRGYRKLSHWIDGLAGVLFVGFGVGLIWSVVRKSAATAG